MRTVFATLAAVVLLLVGLHVAAARRPGDAGHPGETGAFDRVAAAARSLPGLDPSGSTGEDAPAPVDDAAGAAGRDEPEKPGARVYWQYGDESGRVHFVKSREEVPVAFRARAGRIELEARAPSPAGKATAARPGAGATASARRPWAATAAAEPEVLIYTAPWCGWCRKALAYLEAKGVPYENRDIESNPANKSELLKRSGRTSIPFLVIGGETVRGFDEPRIEALLAGRG